MSATDDNSTTTDTISIPTSTPNVDHGWPTGLPQAPADQPGPMEREQDDHLRKIGMVP